MADPASTVDIAELVLSSPNLRAKLGYPRFQGGALRVLVLDAAYHLVDEAKRALTEAGAVVSTLPVADDAPTMVRALLERLIHCRPDFVLTINHLGFDAGGSIGKILETLEIPVAAWYVDSPLFVLRGTPVPAAKLTTLFTWERALLPVYRDVCDAAWLPLAADPTRFDGSRDEAAVEGIAFVGNSGAGAQQKWQDRIPEAAEPQVLRLEQSLQPQDPAPFLSSDLLEDPMAADCLAAATWRANSRLRAEFLAPFLDEGLTLYGDAGWPSVLPGSEPLEGPAYGSELAEVYRQHAVQLNITSLQMPSAVNQRVFDAPTAGGFVLTDLQDDLLELFEEDEIATYASAEEALDKARYYLKHPERRAALIERGRERIFAQHTYLHRARALMQHMQRRYGSQVVAPSERRAG